MSPIEGAIIKKFGTIKPDDREEIKGMLSKETLGDGGSVI